MQFNVKNFFNISLDLIIIILFFIALLLLFPFSTFANTYTNTFDPTIINSFTNTTNSGYSVDVDPNTYSYPTSNLSQACVRVAVPWSLLLPSYATSINSLTIFYRLYSPNVSNTFYFSDGQYASATLNNITQNTIVDGSIDLVPLNGYSVETFRAKTQDSSICSNVVSSNSAGRIYNISYAISYEAPEQTTGGGGTTNIDSFTGTASSAIADYLKLQYIFMSVVVFGIAVYIGTIIYKR